MTPLLALCHDTSKAALMGRTYCVLLKERLHSLGVEDWQVDEFIEIISESLSAIDRVVDAYYLAEKTELEPA